MSKNILADQDFGNIARILNLPDPTAGKHAATRDYVDARFEQLAWKEAVRASSTANINLAAPGANIDGIAMAANDRFLAKDQTTTTENGIYVWNGAAVAATRAADASTFDELESAIVTAEEGTANGGTSWRQTAVNGVIGTNAPAFVSFGASSGGGGWTQIGSTINTTSGTSASFTSIPSTYSDLLLVFEGVSHNNGTATNFRLGLSDDGVNWTADTPINNTTFANTATIYGGLLIPGYRKTAGLTPMLVESLTADRTISASIGLAFALAWRIAAGIQALRITVQAGSFDAGALKLFAR